MEEITLIVENTGGTEPQFEGTLRLEGSGNAIINWGDGSLAEEIVLQAPSLEPGKAQYLVTHSYGDRDFEDEEDLKTVMIQGNIEGLFAKGPKARVLHERVTALDIRKCPGLKRLECDNNSLTELDLTKNNKLLQVNCGGNNLAALDISQNPELESLDCGKNMLEREALLALFNALPNREGQERGRLILERYRDTRSIIDHIKNNGKKYKLWPWALDYMLCSAGAEDLSAYLTNLFRTSDKSVIKAGVAAKISGKKRNEYWIEELAKRGIL